ncbi:hypothetical protein GH733_010217 [Mirounga leonina]|nr:hypothetical protein GH733_010217 [Mirounga leonina]
MRRASLSLCPGTPTSTVWSSESTRTSCSWGPTLIRLNTEEGAAWLEEGMTPQLGLPLPLGGSGGCGHSASTPMRTSSTWTLITGDPGIPEHTPDRGTPSPPFSSSFLCPFLSPSQLSLALLWAASRINFSEPCPVTTELKAPCSALNMSLVVRVLCCGYRSRSETTCA